MRILHHLKNYSVYLTDLIDFKPAKTRFKNSFIIKFLNLLNILLIVLWFQTNECLDINAELLIDS